MTREPEIVTVRQARPEDRFAAEQVFAAAFASVRRVYRPTPEAARRQKRRFHDGVRLVAELEGEIVGTLQLAIQSDHLFISGLAVHPDHQRQGVARALVDSVVDLATQNDCERIDLETIAQTGNVAIFEGLGFRPVSATTPKWCTSEHYEALTSVRMNRHVR